MMTSAQRAILTIAFVSGMLVTAISGASAQDFTPKVLQHKEYHPELAWAQLILLQVEAKTGSKPADPTLLHKTLREQFEDVGLTVTTVPTDDHDVRVTITCEEPEVAALPVPAPIQTSEPEPSPPCKLQYSFQGTPQEWQRIDRIVFNQGLEAARRASVTATRTNTASYAVRYLEEYHVPLLLLAEWNQVARLVMLMQRPTIAISQQQRILRLLGEIRADSAFDHILKAASDERLSLDAIAALGHFGNRARDHLVQLLTQSPRVDAQIAAARSLGQVVGTTGDASLTPLFLKLLTVPATPIPLQIELVWALGKAPDFRAFQPLEQMEKELWLLRTNDPQVDKLREALNWSIREVKQGGHGDDY